MAILHCSMLFFGNSPLELLFSNGWSYFGKVKCIFWLATVPKNGNVAELVQCYFGIITHCLPLDQNVLKIKTLVMTCKSISNGWAKLLPLPKFWFVKDGAPMLGQISCQNLVKPYLVPNLAQEMTLPNLLLIVYH